MPDQPNALGQTGGREGVECPECRGYGEVAGPINFHKCPTCGGTGRVESRKDGFIADVEQLMRKLEIDGKDDPLCREAWGTLDECLARIVESPERAKPDPMCTCDDHDPEPSPDCDVHGKVESPNAETPDQPEAEFAAALKRGFKAAENYGAAEENAAHGTVGAERHSRKAQQELSKARDECMRLFREMQSALLRSSEMEGHLQGELGVKGELLHQAHARIEELEAIQKADSPADLGELLDNYGASIVNWVAFHSRKATPVEQGESIRKCARAREAIERWGAEKERHQQHLLDSLGRDACRAEDLEDMLEKKECELETVKQEQNKNKEIQGNPYNLLGFTERTGE